MVRTFYMTNIPYVYCDRNLASTTTISLLATSKYNIARALETFKETLEV